MVVDDQDSDTNHETPSPELRQEQGIPIVCPSSDDGTGTGGRRGPRPAVLFPGVEPGCFAP
ncbi:hypothetical protein GCM10010095_49650 [Streptomyces anthocyanicus]|uniref:Uncharacterized protein n=1 Tax=Streptomyces violaceolatus TaxID=67378 RepID=A0ABN3TAI1_9ACTN|nr:hypothetical protein JCM4020_33150 [Streptomyces coelicolor]BDE39907.1 hypothetical protein SLITK23_31520 [Streptomyces lividans]GGL58623.1 hypothetical protein GCM10010095_49650 [Streptomyces anthocyanicus]GHA49616.1 hypothetical protein GCM10010391_37840 [Streptomyces anthocyanicus]GHC25174.1 hypothetical protein GCM10010348_58590 [Streptomyces anthocyanicus]